MAIITLRVPDEELALIDAEAGGNRTRFMLMAAHETARRLRRARFDAEVSRILLEDVERDQAISDEFSVTLSDGLA